MTEYFTTPAFKIAAIKLLLQWLLSAEHNKNETNKSQIVQEALLKNR